MDDLKRTRPQRDELLWQLSRELLVSDYDENAWKKAGLKDQAIRLINLLRSAMWPQVFCMDGVTRQPSAALVCDRLEQAASLLTEILKTVWPENPDPEGLTYQYLADLPAIKALLQTDVQAAYEGDPAARNTQEVMLAYPAFEVISIFRLAHRLFELQVPLLPRMMTEYAHRLTGADIHPGATIGSHFFIDHATGVVIGETTTIGDHVKLYQGVTLGARSFALDDDGNPVKGLKRHPDIGNNVIIYAGATILGGDTCIGNGCVIGGNVWLTHSVEAGKQVLAAQERNQQVR